MARIRLDDAPAERPAKRRRVRLEDEPNSMVRVGDHWYPRHAKLTAWLVGSVPFTEDRAKHVIIRDEQQAGFALRVTNSSKSFIAEGRVRGAGTGRRITVGSADKMTVDDARREARRLLAELDAGRDVVAERRRAKAAQYTVADALRDYCNDAEKGMKRKRPLKSSTITEYRRIADKTLTKLGKLQLAELGGRHLDQLRRDFKTSVANAAIRVLRAATNHAAERERIDRNVFTTAKRRVIDLPPRKNHVARADLGRFLNALHDLQTDDTPDGLRIGGDALLLMTMYGLRRDEVLSMKADEVNAAAGTFRIIDTKNSDPLVLPITDSARTIFDRRTTYAAGIKSPWLFPSVGNRISKTGWLKEPRHAIDRVTEATKISFTPHDLRRTFASIAAKRLPHAMLKAVLNHRQAKSTDITLDYIQVGPDDLLEPLNELHDELDRLRAAAKGMRIVGSDNATPAMAKVI